MVFRVRSPENAARFPENELPRGRAPEYQKDFLNYFRPGRLGYQATFRMKDYQGIRFPELLKPIWNRCAVYEYSLQIEGYIQIKPHTMIRRRNASDLLITILNIKSVSMGKR